jgi:hypothetical protein
MTTPNDELIADLQAESAEWTNDGNTRIPALLDRAIAALSQDAAIQQEPDEYQIRFCNSEGQFDSWKKCDKDFFYAHNDGKDDYTQTRVIYAHPQPATDKAEDYKAKYLELIMQVGNKHPGESRHETALRYIKRAEEPKNTACAASPKQEKQS